MNIQGIAIAVLAIGFAAPAVAHEFDAAVVSPFANDSEIGNEILQGLVFAASERDAHSGMTSDGHLGGVDANFKLVDSAEGLDLVRRVDRGRGQGVAGTARQAEGHHQGEGGQCGGEISHG